jgi:hypothetical protein
MRVAANTEKSLELGGSVLNDISNCAEYIRRRGWSSSDAIKKSFRVQEATQSNM